jgi:glycosyl transferase, family 25
MIKIDIINLKHRNDRKQRVTEELKKIVDLEIDESNFFDALYIPDNGMLGCALSHFTIISNFIKNTKYQYQVIFEDDIVFKKNVFLKDVIGVFKKYPQINLYQFAQLGATGIQNLEGDFWRVVNTTTCSGYIIKREFAPRILMCFAKSINLLSKYHSINNKQEHFIRNNFTIDILWKELQTEFFFVTNFPSYAFQGQSFSDIQKKTVQLGK